MDLDSYHRSRTTGHQPFRSACYAPFVGLSFDMHGTVSVCAFTRATPLGWVGEAPLIDLWTGERAAEIRRAVRADDLDRYCTRCAEEIAGGNLHPVAVGFDPFTAPDDDPWPLRMEFALSNTCNLQCVMCSGEFSSAIRARREGLPPLASPYDDDFVEQLRPFLPRLRQARFLGGEPFLGEVNFRIWELMVETGSGAECNVTTNGTVWTPRMEAVLEALPFSVGVSIDGVRPETVEAVRAGASHARIMEHLGRFVDYRDRHGTSLSLTFCLMVENWREFGDFLRMGEDLGCQVYVNTVRQPPRHSLYRLPTTALREVVDDLRSREASVAEHLSLNRTVWHEQIGRLAAELASRTSRSDRAGAGGTRPVGAATRWEDLADAVGAPGLDEDGLVAVLGAAARDGEVSVLRCAPDDTLVAGDTYAGLDVSHLVGRSSRRVFPYLAEVYGHRTDVLAEATRPGCLVRIVEFGDGVRPPTVVALVVHRRPDEAGTSRIGAVLDRGGPGPAPSPVPVAQPTVRR